MIIYKQQYVCPRCEVFQRSSFTRPSQTSCHFRDYGKQPLIVNIEQAAKLNSTFRTVLWTGEYFQVVLMSIGVDENIGLEVHPDVDQFLRIEEGDGVVMMGPSSQQMTI